MLPGSLVFLFSHSFSSGSFFCFRPRSSLFFLSCWTDIGVCGGGNSKGNINIYYKNRILVKQTTRARLLPMSDNQKPLCGNENQKR
jgi:hypothetical protein